MIEPRGTETIRGMRGHSGKIFNNKTVGIIYSHGLAKLNYFYLNTYQINFGIIVP